VGPPHSLGGSPVKTQVYKDPNEHDPAKAFWIQVVAPGLTTVTEQITNGNVVEVPMTGVNIGGIANPMLDFEITDFNVSSGTPKHVGFNIRVRVRVFIAHIQVALIPVTAQI
jgi:hypothetical protein